MLDVEPNTVSSWCRDLSQPSLLMLARIARLAGTTVSKMLRGVTLEPKPARSTTPAPLIEAEEGDF